MIDKLKLNDLMWIQQGKTQVDEKKKDLGTNFFLQQQGQDDGPKIVASNELDFDINAEMQALMDEMK